MAGGDGVMLLRCGPWLDYSGYTGAINGYMYKCEDDMGASKLVAGVAAVATVIASLYWLIKFSLIKHNKISFIHQNFSQYRAF